MELKFIILLLIIFLIINSKSTENFAVCSKKKNNDINVKNRGNPNYSLSRADCLGAYGKKAISLKLADKIGSSFKDKTNSYPGGCLIKNRTVRYNRKKNPKSDMCKNYSCLEKKIDFDVKVNKKNKGNPNYSLSETDCLGDYGAKAIDYGLASRIGSSFRDNRTHPGGCQIIKYGKVNEIRYNKKKNRKSNRCRRYSCLERKIDDKLKVKIKKNGNPNYSLSECECLGNYGTRAINLGLANEIGTSFTDSKTHPGGCQIIKYGPIKAIRYNKRKNTKSNLCKKYHCLEKDVCNLSLEEAMKYKCKLTVN